MNVRVPKRPRFTPGKSFPTSITDVTSRFSAAEALAKRIHELDGVKGPDDPHDASATIVLTGAEWFDLLSKANTVVPPEDA